MSLSDRTRSLVNRWLGVGLAAVIAVITLGLGVTGRLNLYISPDTVWFACIAATITLAIAVWTCTLPLGAEGDHGHDHGQSPVAAPTVKPALSADEALALAAQRRAERKAREAALEVVFPKSAVYVLEKMSHGFKRTGGAGAAGFYDAGGAAQAPLKDLGVHPETGDPVHVLAGRFGPYVKSGKINATLPKGVAPEDLTLDAALPLLAAKADAAPKKKAPAKKAATSKAEGKTTAPKKKAPAKKKAGT